ncbi:MAG: hypothetical protein ABSH28_12990 [Acidobacteriota bacterium]|jgi:hypothetical protein
MLSNDQSKIVVELVRSNARILRRERPKILRLMHRLIEAQEEQIPEQFLLPFSSSLRGATEGDRFEESALPASVGLLFNKNQRWSCWNLATLERFGARIRGEFGAATEDAVLSGDGAALVGLYQDPGAYPAACWAAVLKDGTCVNGAKPKTFSPPADDWSEKIRLGNSIWRRPKPIFLVTLLAGHVGDSTTSPTPPMWPHLGLALLAWRDQFGVNEVLQMGAELAQQEEVKRGIAIVTHIFPELEKWANPEKLGIPVWERKFAIPIATRRLVLGERE